MQTKLTIIIPVYNDEKLLPKAIESVSSQLREDIELIVIDDCSNDRSFEIAKSYKEVKALKNDKNSGPAKTRNRAIKEAKGEILAFMDSDCWADESWVENILKAFEDKNINVVMGDVTIPKSTFLGDSISAQGFPGGGRLGFENVWKVDRDGYTKHITSCNFAARKSIFERYGVFDESFPFPGGEDPELAFRWSKQGVKIKYDKSIKMNHVPRKDLRSYIKWMMVRGRSNYYFKKKVGKVGGFIKLRLWSTKNMIRKYKFDLKLPLILFLLGLAFVLQQYGYVKENRLNKK